VVIYGNLLVIYHGTCSKHVTYR